jgi:hypothetical protein
VSRRILKTICVTMGLAPVQALAQEPAKTTDDFGAEFGRLVGSEARCALRFKADAVEAVIRQNVAADDLQFANIFSAYASLTDGRIEDMTATERLVHCTTAERNARALGLID